MGDPDQRDRHIKLGHEICRPNTLFRDCDSGMVWRLDAWTASTVTLTAEETGQHAVYPIETFEEAIWTGQFEKIPTVFDLPSE